MSNCEMGTQRGGHADIPVLAHCTAETWPGLVKYRIASSIDSAVQFYRDEMPKNGWSAMDGMLIQPHIAVLSYAKDDKVATIIMNRDRTVKTMVVIHISPS